MRHGSRHWFNRQVQPKMAGHPKRPGRAKPFGSIDTLLEASAQMFLARQFARDAENPKVRRRAEISAHAWSCYFHRCEELTTDGILLCRRVRAEKLSEIEREIICALLLARLSIVED